MVLDHLIVTHRTRWQPGYQPRNIRAARQYRPTITAWFRLRVRAKKAADGEPAAFVRKGTDYSSRQEVMRNSLLAP
jgi:hypothetical protein